MKSIQKIALVGGVLLTSSALLYSFTQSNGEGGKKKKYQIIHHSNGETVTYDTVIPMSSSLTPEQFVSSKGISSEHVEIVKLPSISEFEAERKMIKTFVHEMEIESDGEGSNKEVELTVEIDENGEMITKKRVNGEEVEISEDELLEIKSSHGKHGKVIEMRFDDEGDQAFEERVEISVEVDDEGNVITKKIVNGEEVEISEDDLEKLHVFEMKDGDDINVFIDSEEFGEEMKTLELEIEKLIEEAGDDVQIITKRIEMDGDDDFEWISENGEQHIQMISTDDEDHTIVLVTENFDENTSSQAKIMLEESNSETTIFPNPNNGTFRIALNNDEAVKTKIVITDAKGKKVFEENLGKFSGKYDKEVNLKEFGSGTYTITIESGNNKEVNKIIVQ